MPNTTNFNWATPADTDLVKDGAAAIRTLGNSIDSSFVDLKGGTTGQVLTKASNTDLDFTFSTVDPLVILDAKGDLISATAADTPARLAVGANNTVLTADSSTSTGLKWAAPSSGLTFISNGSFTTSSSVNVSDVFSASYLNYRIYVDITANSTDQGIDMRMRVSGSNNTNSDHNSQYLRGLNTTASTAKFQSQNKFNEIMSGTSGTIFCNGIIDIFNPFASEKTNGISYASSMGSSIYTTVKIVGFGKDDTTSYTGFALIPDTGTITGTYRVYGLG
jgi:hypothetical protein